MNQIGDKGDKRENVPIGNLYLDPNNYRFIHFKDYVKVPENEILKDSVQNRTRAFLSGSRRESLKDLIDSFKKNGYLPVDQIQVRSIDGGDDGGDEKKYLVIEGNRRIAALMELYDDFSRNLDIGNLSPSIFAGVPVRLYEEIDEVHHFVLMGLKHISGNRKWPPLNQAEMLRDYTVTHKMSEDDVVKALGINIKTLRRALRTLSLVDEYRKSDYRDQFKVDMYALFEEAVRSPRIRQWLNWDDDTMKPRDKINEERFFSWISEDEEPTDPENPDAGQKVLEPIIRKSSEIRELIQFIDDPKAVDTMEQSRSISEAYFRSDKIGQDKFENALNIIEDQIAVASRFSGYAAGGNEEKLEGLLDKLKGLGVAGGYSEILFNKDIRREVFVTVKNSLFSSLSIGKYKVLENVTIKKLNRVNIFAGINNSGKSSLLEAVYLLTVQNDIHAFFETMRRRGKFCTSLNPAWLAAEFNDEIRMEGVFDGKPTSTSISPCQEEDEDFDKTAYLGTVKIQSRFMDETLTARARIFENKQSRMFFKSIKRICNSVFSSPFSMQNKEDLIFFHEKSVETKHIDRILDFLRSSVDRGIDNIELAGELKRFLVTHSDFPRALDLTQFGEGMQRVFHITLQFAAAQNGVILIDELENAIHFSLLKDFTRFIQQLAEKFNTQVFITSHSKECIDAFFDNGLENGPISAYRLVKEGKNVECKHIDGEKFSRLIRSIDADLRGDP